MQATMPMNTHHSPRCQPYTVTDARADHARQAEQGTPHGDILRAPDAPLALAALVDDASQNGSDEDRADPAHGEHDGGDSPHAPGSAAVKSVLQFVGWDKLAKPAPAHRMPFSDTALIIRCRWPIVAQVDGAEPLDGLCQPGAE